MGYISLAKWALGVFGVSWVAYNYKESADHSSSIASSIASAVKSLEKPIIITAGSLAVLSYLKKK